LALFIIACCRNISWSIYQQPVNYSSLGFNKIIISPFDACMLVKTFVRHIIFTYPWKCNS
jgi:hypothetical protein